jgi:hypothetical protein
MEWREGEAACTDAGRVGKSGYPAWETRIQAITQAPDVASRDEKPAATSLNEKGVEWILALT